MADTTLKVRLLNASKTHAEWASADPVLKKGEIAYSSDKQQIRVGDGSSNWSQLSYIDADHIVGLSNSGSTITYIKADASTDTITLPSYDIATSTTAGLIKSGGDIIVDSNGVVTVSASAASTTSSILNNYYTSSTRPTDADVQGAQVLGNGGITTFKATSSMTSNKPSWDGHIIHCFWDGNNGYDSQLFLANSSASSATLQSRHMNGGTWSSWITYLSSSNYSNYALPLSGGTLTGALTLKGADLKLGTSGTSSNDSGDIVWLYGDGTEKARIWQSDSYTTKAGPYYRIYKADGTSLYSGSLPLADGTGASGTWAINVTGHSESVKDSGNSNLIIFTYSGAGLNYADYTWLAGWNGYELRAVHKSQFLASTGGTMTGTITFNKASDGALISNTYSSTTYNLIRNHNNGNISISASSARLYLGYENTTGIDFLNGKMNLNSSGELYVSSNIVLNTNAKYLYWKYSTGDNRILCGVNGDNAAFFGYGGYAAGVGASYFDGNTVYIRSKGNVYIGVDGKRTTIDSNGNLNTRFLYLGDASNNAAIEIYHNTPYIDFHFGRSTADYTSRIIESSSGVLSVSGALSVGGALTVGGNQTFSSTTPTIWMNSKIAMRSLNDNWLRIADGNDFTNGVYFGNRTVRTDGNFRVGSGASSTNYTHITQTTIWSHSYDAYAQVGAQLDNAIATSTTQIYLEARASDKNIGIYAASNGVGAFIVSRAYNSTQITASAPTNGKWYFNCRVDVNADFYYNDYTGTLRKPVASISGAGYRVAYLQSNANNTLTVSGNWGMTDGSLATRTVTASSSDIRLKTNIALSTVQALDTIQKISVKSFDWVNSQEHWNIGMVADELEQIDPLLAIGGGYNEDGSMNIKSINTFYLQGYIIKGIQELSSTSSSHEDRITQLERENKKLKEQLSLLMSNV